jgi:hypothetical protein
MLHIQSTRPVEHRSGIQKSPRRRQRTCPQQIPPNVAWVAFYTDFQNGPLSGSKRAILSASGQYPMPQKNVLPGHWPSFLAWSRLGWSGRNAFSISASARSASGVASAYFPCRESSTRSTAASSCRAAAGMIAVAIQKTIATTPIRPIAWVFGHSSRRFSAWSSNKRRKQLSCSMP